MQTHHFNWYSKNCPNGIIQCCTSRMSPVVYTTGLTVLLEKLPIITAKCLASQLLKRCSQNY